MLRTPMLISKTTFLDFQMCPKNTWLKFHKPELLEQFALSAFELNLVEQGNEVEALARGLWPGGVLVVSAGQAGCEETARLMASNMPAIFQATFVADGFIAKCDVLVPGSVASTWDIYEIKGTNSKKEGSEDRDHISDLTFQAIVMERAGVKVGRTFVVHLNKEYQRHGALHIETLFIKDDSSEQAAEKRSEIEAAMEVAREYLGRADEPGIGCDCHYKARSRQCTTFAHSHPKMPEYSVHDIVRIGSSKRKLTHLVDNNILALGDVPEDFELGDAQANQVRAHKLGRPIVDRNAIAAALSEYTYPLYFFDYETFAPAIPAFEGFGPYQRIPFQFSMHILPEPGGELEHVEYLHEEASDPSARVAGLLSKHIQPGGSVVVWYAPFERGVNAEIAKRQPELARVIERINAQVVDLRDIFANQHYVHPDFRGSTSIKAVLPVLRPELSYKELAIREGATASNAWWQMIAPTTGEAERQEIARALREYCTLDTYAMYAIWRVLWDTVGEVPAARAAAQ